MARIWLGDSRVDVILSDQGGRSGIVGADKWTIDAGGILLWDEDGGFGTGFDVVLERGLGFSCVGLHIKGSGVVLV